MWLQFAVYTGLEYIDFILMTDFHIPSARTSFGPHLHIEDDGKWASAKTEQNI